MTKLVRLNKHLAHQLGMSRRAADLCIDQGRVLVNGKVATLGKVIQPERDEVKVDSSQVSRQAKRYKYILLNKPVGYICSRKQQGITPTIYSLLPKELHSLKVAGRLDKDSCGLVLLTDDGDAIFKLTHPQFGKKKIYHVALNKPLTEPHKNRIQKGIVLEDGASRLQISAPKSDSEEKKPNFYIVSMTEGRNRQIRRTFKALGYTVTHLERIKLGSYELADIKNKQYLHL